MLTEILVADDGSEAGFKAVTFAIDLAADHHAKLHMLCVEETQDFPPSIDTQIVEKGEAERQFTDVFERAQILAELKPIKIEFHLKAGHPVPTIAEFVKEHNIDHLVIGFVGHSALYERIIGGTVERLVETAPCTVTVVK